MRGLLAELKRRRVFRVAALYGVVAWIVAEVASVVFPVLLLPDWTVTLVVALLIGGFPIAMVLAWAFDIGPQGIERTPPLADTAPAPRGQTWLVYGLMLAVAMSGLGWLVWSRLSPEVPASYESIAVMPFANLSGDPANDYFSDGMAEELLNLLAQVEGLQVAARTSSFAFKGQTVDVREIGRQLGVDTVLEGSVRRSGDRVRITAQLVDATSGYHLWSSNYDREMQDIFAVQDEISAEIVKALRGTLGSRQAPEGLPARSAPTDSVDAYTVYLQARHQWKRRGAEPVRRSVELFRQALEMDPGFARAWSGLAAAYVVLPGYTGEDPGPYREQANDAARQALARDPNLAEAHAVLAQLLRDAGDWTGAEAGFFFAISLDPNDSTVRHWYSLLLGRTGRLSESLEQARKAFELDPASPVINVNLANALLALGYDDQARRQWNSAVDLGFDRKVDMSIEVILALRQGELERFREMGRASLEQAGHDPALMEHVQQALEDRAYIPALEAALDEAGMPVPARIGLWTLLGDDERAMEALMAAARDPAGDYTVVWMPEGRSLRQHRRFGEFCERAGLLDYWKQYGMPDDCRLVDGRLRCGFSVVAAAGGPD
jgi:adenylate cyclase